MFEVFAKLDFIAIHFKFKVLSGSDKWFVDYPASEIAS